jgi:DNA-binding NarL/FixJ family response regulator
MTEPEPMPQTLPKLDLPPSVQSPKACRDPRLGPRQLGLTERQIDVLERILRGLPNKLICRELSLAEGTVKVHVSAVLRALGASNRTQAVIAATRLGLTSAEPQNV